jgi:hypothetical protein
MEPSALFIGIIVEGSVTHDFGPGRVWVRVRVGWGEAGCGTFGRGTLVVGCWLVGAPSS